MKRNVIISITGNQKDIFNENSSVELVTVGSLYKKLDKFYLIYNESEITGLNGTTTVKIDGKRVTITHTGDNRSQLIFEEGQKHLCHYDTGVGVFNVGVSTKNIGLSMNERGGELNIFYTLEINNSFASSNSFYISVKEAKSRDNKPRALS